MNSEPSTTHTEPATLVEEMRQVCTSPREWTEVTTPETQKYVLWGRKNGFVLQ